MRRCRDSAGGGGLDLSRIDWLTWQLLLVIDAEFEAHERALRLYARSLFEALATRGI